MRVTKRFHTYIDGKREEFAPGDDLPPDMVEEYGLVIKGYVADDEPKRIKPKK